MLLTITNQKLGQYSYAEYNEKHNTITYRKLQLSTEGINYFIKANTTAIYDLIYNISSGLGVLIHTVDAHQF